jgi:hypothetical protein
MFGYFAEAPEGAAMICEFPMIAEWWGRMAARPSFQTVCVGQ